MISKCLFPAAGYGTRFLPVTKSVPKEMLPILSKPLLHYGVDEAFSAGISNMAIVTGKGKRAIEDYFDSEFEIKVNSKNLSLDHYLKDVNQLINQSTFTYVRQKKILGLGHAILTGKPLIGDESFAVILADDLCFNYSESVLSQMMKIYSRFKCSIVAIQEIPKDETENYGIISGKLIDESNNIYQVSEMIEKPKKANAPSNMAIVGRYILTPDIFQILQTLKPDKNSEIQLTDALNIQAKKGGVLAYKFKGKRFDCGSIKGFVKATNHFAQLENLI